MRTGASRAGKRLRFLALPLALLIMGTAAPAAEASPHRRDSAPGTVPSASVNATACEDLAAQSFPSFSLTRAAANTSGTYSIPTPTGGTQTITGLPDFCDVAAQWKDSAGNVDNIAIWLPLTSWNGRFRGVGGGGYWCGPAYLGFGALSADLAGSLKAGYSTASTDCGHAPTQADGSFALKPDGTLNRELINDFASAGIHRMTVAGKAVSRALYGAGPVKSYFFGCSTGGRQGLMEAQRYPEDYDGIVAGAPAINWTKFVTAEIWPQLVMKESHDFLPICKQEAFTDAVIRACDPLDGVTDGVIGDVDGCRWNPTALVGVRTPCGTVTAADATVIARIWQGPRTATGRPLWYGLRPGTDIAGRFIPGIGPTGLGWTSTENGVTTGRPFPIMLAWYRYWLLRNPEWDWKTLTYARFEQLFARSVAEFSSEIATDDPDLTAFKEAGGKLVMWHGLTDGQIFPQGAVDYYRRLTGTMGGPGETISFARLFLAPGVEHCGGGAGPAPADPFAALVNWVENRRSPETLLATRIDPATGRVIMSRPLCPYPLVARYTGRGDTDSAQNFTCAGGYRNGVNDSPPRERDL